VLSAILYDGVYGDAPPERGNILSSRYRKGVPFSGWRYVKEIPSQGKVYERFPIFPNLVCERVKGSGPRAEHPRMKSVGVPPPPSYEFQKKGKIQSTLLQCAKVYSHYYLVC